MVVDRAGHLRGVLPLQALLVNPGTTEVGELMERDPLAFHTDDPLTGGGRRVRALRPDLRAGGQRPRPAVGCLNVDEVLEYVKTNSQRDLLAQVGLPQDEDLFAPVLARRATAGPGWHST
jgi:magnesium transporter